MNALQPRIRILWVGRAIISAGIVGGVGYAAATYTDVPVEWPIAIAGLLLVVGVLHALLRYRNWRYEIREDSLYLERGVLTEVRTAVPLVRIQHVDSRRSALERLVGLASTVVYTAGSRGADVRIPGLTPDDASALRERLKRLAIEADGEDAV
ncbi:PH domain-containing protein [Halalkalirubrum salinum]|uniref:PH domain-containing protein n=1 Tax=Halalkalirubrum salinum TaxID=2563889 RepID=UPI0010FB89D3|nr:PH domain-containing protein [Halalkalirubrum salinum]